MASCIHCGEDLLALPADSSASPPQRTCERCLQAHSLVRAEPSHTEPFAHAQSNSIAAEVLAFPATATLIAINLLVFAAMVLSGVSALRPVNEQLIRWGANFGPMTMDQQWWRLLTSTFVHIGAIHLALNMWCLWNLGLFGERIYGSWTFLGLYILSGLGGSVASIARDPLIVSAGASGAIFGLAGALIATFKLGNLPLPPSVLRSTLRSLLAFAGYNLLFGFVYRGIDNGAHLGGLVAGLLLGAALSRVFQMQSRMRRTAARLIVLAAAAVLVAASARFVYAFRAPAVKLAMAESSLSRGNAGSAIQDLRAAVELQPRNAVAHARLGNALLATRQLSKAEAEFQQAIALNPADFATRKQLAAVYAQTSRPGEAVRLLDAARNQSAPDVEIEYGLGILLQQMGHYQDALRPLENAIHLQPGFAPAHYALGTSYLRLQRSVEAWNALLHATQLAPRNPDFMMAFANACEARGMRAEADEASAKAYALRRGTKTRQ